MYKSLQNYKEQLIKVRQAFINKSDKDFSKNEISMKNTKLSVIQIRSLKRKKNRNNGINKYVVLMYYLL